MLKPDIHKQFKAICAQSGKTMSEVALVAIMQFIKKSEIKQKPVK